jgi:hypothetical protein
MSLCTEAYIGDEALHGTAVKRHRAHGFMAIAFAGK